MDIVMIFLLSYMETVLLLLKIVVVEQVALLLFYLYVPEFKT